MSDQAARMSAERDCDASAKETARNSLGQAALVSFSYWSNGVLVTMKARTLTEALAKLVEGDENGTLSPNSIQTGDGLVIDGECLRYTLDLFTLFNERISGCAWGNGQRGPKRLDLSGGAIWIRVVPEQLVKELGEELILSRFTDHERVVAERDARIKELAERYRAEGDKFDARVQAEGNDSLAFIARSWCREIEVDLRSLLAEEPAGEGWPDLVADPGREVGGTVTRPAGEKEES